MTHQIHPFRFPTTTVLVDDNRSFLESISLHLDSPFRLYSSASEALAYLRNHCSRPTTSSQYLSACDGLLSFDAGSAEPVMADLGLIHQIVFNTKRFETVSVVVVDFNMPETDGISLCHQIRDLSVKKIMLTGQADERLAVRAFNEKIIDRFILKQDQNAVSRLVAAIDELQHEFFASCGHTITDMLSVGSYKYLSDPSFVEEFTHICQELKVAEYYLMNKPRSILMLGSQGQANLLLVMTETDFQFHLEVAIETAAPKELIEIIEQRQHIPFFWPDCTYQPSRKHWLQCMHPAKIIHGKERFYYAIIAIPPEMLGINSIVPYETYLASQDI